MKAVVYHGPGDIRLEDVPEPRIEAPTDAIVRLTATAICGTDLHPIRGTVQGMAPGTILGHEGVGVVEAVGADIRNLSPDDRVVIPSTIACGYCSYCRAGYYSQCDNANPGGPRAGTAYFGSPKSNGGFQGLQAEKARIPYAAANLVKIPGDVSDEQAIFLSDILPTGWFGAKLAEIKEGDTVAVFGCGPVGQFAIMSAKHFRAGRIFAVDAVPDRLAMARAQGAEAIDFDREDPVEAILRLTGGIGADRAIDAVGIDAMRPGRESGPEGAGAAGTDWSHGDEPSQVLRWAVDCLAKAGTLAIIGVYPENAETFPIGKAMNRNLTVKMGNCNHRRYIPVLLELVRSGVLRPEEVLTRLEPLKDAIHAYHAFDRRQPGWVKVELEPAA
jgi:threonine dehydrogenase-like Zn-dependent dehydrogenase